MNPAQAGKAFKLFSDKLIKESRVAEVAALTTLNGDLQGRIFNQGKATDGSSLGTYRSKSYKKKRQNPPDGSGGRQIIKKDLQFYGDLRGNISLGITNGNKNALGFKSDGARLIATYQEGKRQVGKPIFTPSKGELDAMAAAYLKEVTKIIRRV